MKIQPGESTRRVLLGDSINIKIQSKCRDVWLFEQDVLIFPKTVVCLFFFQLLIILEVEWVVSEVRT